MLGNADAIASIAVSDLEALARELSAHGVSFEHYEFPQTTRKGDVHYFKNLKQAWFKDPNGNILAIIS